MIFIIYTSHDCESVLYRSYLVDAFEAEPDLVMLDKFYEYQEKAEIYHLYHSIHRYTVCNQLYVCACVRVVYLCVWV